MGTAGAAEEGEAAIPAFNPEGGPRFAGPQALLQHDLGRTPLLKKKPQDLCVVTLLLSVPPAGRERSLGGSQGLVWGLPESGQMLEASPKEVARLAPCCPAARQLCGRLGLISTAHGGRGFHASRGPWLHSSPGGLYQNKDHIFVSLCV